MRRYWVKTIMITAWITTVTLSFTSCEKDETNDHEQIQSEYTLMLYGCGGGDLDQYMQRNLEEMLLVGETEKVKMTWQIKYSAKYQNDPEKKGTQRFVVEDKDGDLRVDEKETFDASLPLYDPDNLADFIRWSKMKRPAKNYILILWNHGNGWFPTVDQPKSKAVLADDNVGGLGMSIDELVAGIKKSDTHLKMVYYDACLMNMLENVCGLTEVSDYALGSAHSVPSLGGLYASLINGLNSNMDFETGIKKYCKNVIGHWNLYELKIDLALTNLSKLAPVMTTLSKISNELIMTYDKYKEAYDNADDNTYNVANKTAPFVDIISYVKNVALMSENPKLINLSGELVQNADDAIVCSEITNALSPQKTSWGVTLISDGTWRIKRENGETLILYWNGTKELITPTGEKTTSTWGSTGADSYEKLAFDKATNWSKWLRVKQPDKSDKDYKLLLSDKTF